MAGFMNDNFDGAFATPFDGLISLAPWIAIAAIIVSIYMLARAVITLKLLKKIKREISEIEIKHVKVQNIVNITFSAVSMTCGVMLLFYLNN